MEYRNKNNGKIVTITREEEHFVWFMMNGIKIVVAKNRFYKVYEKIGEK